MLQYSQGVHETMPGAGAYVLGEHAKHFVEPVPEAKVPSMQFTQTTLPVVLVYFPEVHGEQTLALIAPVDADEVPSGQGWQVDAVPAPAAVE